MPSDPEDIFPVRLHSFRKSRQVSSQCSYDNDPPPLVTEYFADGTSVLSREGYLPGYSCTDLSGIPPPSYIDCSYPPPAYEEVVSSEAVAPKSQKPPQKGKWIFWIIMFFVILTLGASLLAIGLKHWINGTCSDGKFLTMWGITTGTALIVSAVIGIIRPLRKSLLNFVDRYTGIKVLAFGTVLIWCITGMTTVARYKDSEDEQCDKQVMDVTSATCIIFFMFVFVLCYCGRCFSTRSSVDGVDT